MAVQAPASSLGFTVAPTYGEHKTGDELETAARVYEQTFEYILLLYLPAVAGIVLLAEPGIRHIFGPDYLGAVPVLMVFSGFALFQAIDKITNDSLDYLGRGRERAIGKVSTAVLNFFLNLVLIPTIGIVGAALATVCSFGAMVLYNIYLMNTEVPLRISRMGWSVVRTAGIALLMALVVFVSGTYVDGVISLFATIATGVATWAVLSVLSGLIDPGRVLNHM
jgi:O-antigen/teichoic acid export membrane protein